MHAVYSSKRCSLYYVTDNLYGDMSYNTICLAQATLLTLPTLIYVHCSLVPMLLPAFQFCMLTSKRAWYLIVYMLVMYGKGRGRVEMEQRTAVF